MGRLKAINKRMDSFFDTPISVYNGATDNVGAVCPLRAFLFSKRHIDDVMRVRSLYGTEAYKREKKRLPMAAVSGVFKTRTLSGLVSHSGLLCIDIDAKDNPNLDIKTDVMPFLSSLPYVLYAGMSVSGNGYFAIIPLLHSGLHRQQFESLKQEFAAHNIIIDKGCGDVTRTRFLSYDPQPYINEDASMYDGLVSSSAPSPSASLYSHQSSFHPSRPEGGITEEQKVELCVQLIEQMRLDITAGYANWVSIGASLASMGEAGRNFFHRVSRFNPEYKYAQTDYKFTNVMKTMRNFNLGYFLDVCYRNGIRYTDALRGSRN